MTGLNFQNQMMEFFHEGKGDMFFKLWREYLPPAVQDSDQVAQKLEFYLSIYFTVYPIKYNQPQVMCLYTSLWSRDDNSKALKWMRTCAFTLVVSLKQNTGNTLD